MSAEVSVSDDVNQGGPENDHQHFDDIHGDHLAGIDQGPGPHLPHDGDAGVFGTPEHDAAHHHAQTEDFNCNGVSELSIYECLTGEHVTEVREGVEAAQLGYMTTNGTLPEHMGRWLEHRGIECHENPHGTFIDLIQELRDGNKVIVGVNSDALWHSSDTIQAFGHQAADHAIWLTGVDASDPHHVKVVINDSGKPDGAGNVYDLHELEQVLHNPGFHYVATGHGKDLHLPDHPEGYDPEHGTFSGLDEFLHEHGAAMMSVAGTAAAAAMALRRKQSKPASPQDGVVQEKPVVESPPLILLPAPPVRLEDMTRAERDAVLRKI